MCPRHLYFKESHLFHEIVGEDGMAKKGKEGGHSLE